MQNEKRKIFPLSYLFLLLLITFVGCAFWAKKGYDYYTAQARLPQNMQLFLKQAQRLHFQNLDSLDSFVGLHREFEVFDEEIHEYKIQKKHLIDFSRAYDGDTVAFSRLLSAMDSRDDWEVLHLFFVLSELDSTQPAQKLRELIKVSRGNRRENFLEALKIRSKQNAFNIAHGIYRHRDDQTSNKINEPIERKLKFNPDMVESLLRRGIDNNTLQNLRQTRDILNDVLQNGDMRQYCRAREIIIDVLPQDDTSSFFRKFEDFRYLLAYPSPHDTINETSSVRDVLSTIRNELCDIEAILLETKIESSLVKTVCTNVFITDNRNSLQRYANLHGELKCRSLKLSVYEDYANVSINYFEIDPFWKEKWFYFSKNKLSEQISYGTGRGSTFFHLQRINGVWKEIGMRIEGVS